MGLFSFGRKKLEDGFEFVIDGIYALKGNSAVAAGKLTSCLLYTSPSPRD